MPLLNDIRYLKEINYKIKKVHSKTQKLLEIIFNSWKKNE